MKSTGLVDDGIQPFPIFHRTYFKVINYISFIIIYAIHVSANLW